MGQTVPFWDSQDEFGDTSLLISDMAMAQSLARALGDSTSVLLRRHGANCVGTDLRRAVFAAHCMNTNAHIQFQSMQIGTATFLTPGEVEASTAAHFSGLPIPRTWNMWADRLPAE